METLILVTCIISTDGHTEKGFVLIKESEQTQLVEQAEKLCSSKSPFYVPVKREPKVEKSNGQ